MQAWSVDLEGVLVICSEVQFHLKEKVYIHTRATIKGEEVDICARKMVSPSDRGYCVAARLNI